MLWKHLSLPDPTPVQYDMAVYLQGGPDRSIIQAYRGAGKSWLTSAFVLWTLYWDAQKRIMVASASKERADAFSKFCMQLIYDVPDLQHMAPRDGQRKSLIAFEVADARPDHSPSVKSVGITGQITGSRADIIVADDIEVPKNSMTQDQRDKLEMLVTEFDAILKPLPGARIIMLGTPQCEDSLYTKLPEKGYQTQIWPARMPTEAKVDDYRGNLAPFVVERFGTVEPGVPLDPDRFHEEDLQKREVGYGKSGFALQFMLDTSLSDQERYPLKCSDMIVMDIDKDVAPVKIAYGSATDQLIADLPCSGMRGDRYYQPMYTSDDLKPYDASIMFIDPSGRGTDETGYCVIKVLNGILFMRRAGGLKGGYDEVTLTTLSHIARAESVDTIWVESNFGDGMFVTLLEPVLQKIHACHIEEERHSTQKEVRIIDTLEPVLNQHKLVIDKGIIRGDMTVEHPKFSLVYQLTRITRERNCLAKDDRLDAMAGCVAKCIEYLGDDHEDAEERYRQEKLDEELENFMQNAVGNYKIRQPNWTDVR